jgi:hypothetical protein
MERGAEIGSIVGVIVCIAFCITAFSTQLLIGRFIPTDLGNLLTFMLTGSFVCFLIGGTLGAALAVVVDTLRPLFIALFCSTERFEREFGPSSTPSSQSEQQDNRG